MTALLVATPPLLRGLHAAARPMCTVFGTLDILPVIIAVLFVAYCLSSIICC
jgi:hypothetical protein